MSRIKVAIIDDGINCDFLDNNIDVTHIDICNKKETYENRDTMIVPSHGTIVAGFILKNFSDIILTDIKVLDHFAEGKIEDLISALEKCFKLDVDIIHMSIGTTSDNKINLLQTVTNKLSKQGKLIIASSNNNDIITYPASFSNVIGIKKGGRTIKVLNSVLNINYKIHSDERLNLINFSNSIGCNSNSFVSAAFTSKIIQLKYKNPHMENLEILKLFERTNCLDSINYLQSSTVEPLNTINNYDIPIVEFKNEVNSIEELSNYFIEDDYRTFILRTKEYSHLEKNYFDYCYINQIITALSIDLCFLVTAPNMIVNNLPKEVLSFSGSYKGKDLKKMILDYYL